uniref:Ig-like domain-containing protein n=1 Tax=Poecilia formosa TaxID=48698 RepID=A0A087XI03_POEFO
YKVFGPSKPVSAEERKDAVLQCRLEPELDVTSLTVEWKLQKLLMFIFIFKVSSSTEASHDVSQVLGFMEVLHCCNKSIVMVDLKIKTLGLLFRFNIHNLKGFEIPSFTDPLFTGGYKVIGVSQPIRAAPGDDVVLPCWVSPNWDATRKTVEWSRLDQRQDSTKKYVLVYRALKLDRRLMMESYIGKASLIPEALRSGNVTLKLSNVTVNDSGRYKCFL